MWLVTYFKHFLNNFVFLLMIFLVLVYMSRLKRFIVSHMQDEYLSLSQEAKLNICLIRLENSRKSGKLYIILSCPRSTVVMHKTETCGKCSIPADYASAMQLQSVKLG